MSITPVSHFVSSGSSSAGAVQLSWGSYGQWHSQRGEQSTMFFRHLKHHVKLSSFVFGAFRSDKSKAEASPLSCSGSLELL